MNGCSDCEGIRSAIHSLTAIQDGLTSDLGYVPEAEAEALENARASVAETLARMEALMASHERVMGGPEAVIEQG